jgi:hypothetical protein
VYCDIRCRKAAHRRRQREREAPELRQLSEPAPAQPLTRDALFEEALSEERLAIYVAASAKSSWKAAAWLLEHRYPERWEAASRQVEPTGASDEVVRKVLQLVPRGE